MTVTTDCRLHEPVSVREGWSPRGGLLPLHHRPRRHPRYRARGHHPARCWEPRQSPGGRPQQQEERDYGGHADGPPEELLPAQHHAGHHAAVQDLHRVARGSGQCEEGLRNKLALTLSSRVRAR